MTKARTKATLYSKANPPPTHEAAFERLAELDTTIEIISVDLDKTTIDDFVDDESFTDWKRRATAVVGHLRGERKFVCRFLGLVGDSYLTVEYYAIVRADAGSKARIYAAEMAELYTPQFSLDAKPASIEEAQRRLEVLRRHQWRSQTWLAELVASVRGTLGRQAKKKAFAPLSQIYESIIQENRVITDYLRPFGIVPQHKWVGFLLDLLDRADPAALNLSEDERRILAEIRKVRI